MGILCARGSASPPRLLTAFWGIVSAVAAVVLLLVGGLTALEQAMVVVSAPFMIVMVILTVDLLKQLRLEPCSARPVDPPRCGCGSASARRCGPTGTGGRGSWRAVIRYPIASPVGGLLLATRGQYHHRWSWTGIPAASRRTASRRDVAGHRRVVHSSIRGPTSRPKWIGS
jgi:BCCT, betaine/carnitine/choline family transporter